MVKIVLRGSTTYTSRHIEMVHCSSGTILVSMTNGGEHPKFAYQLRPGEYATFLYEDGGIEVRIDE